MKKNVTTKERRQNRVRMKIRRSTRPRLTVFRSNKFIYAQIIDDQNGKTLVAVSPKEIAKKSGEKKVEIGFALGKLVAEKAKKKKISKVVFDRGSFAYHGRIKAVADGAREGGLTF